MLRLPIRLCAFSVALAAFAACTKDYYDSDFMQQQARDAFPVLVENVDPTHTWETLTLVRASVTFGTSAPDSMWVYSGNPFAKDQSARLLYRTAVTSGLNEFSFDKPSASKYVFLLTRNAEGLASAVADTVTSEGTLTHDFAASAKSAPRSRAKAPVWDSFYPSTRAANYDYGWEPAAVVATDTSIFPTAAPEGATALPAVYDYNNFVSEGADYLVTSETKVINCSNPANFYVQGSVSLSNIYFGGTATGRIILLPGSRLTMNGLALGVNTTLTICRGATLNCGSGNLQLSNNCQTVYNAGTILCGQFFSSTQREFYNLGTVTVSGDASNLTNLYFFNAPLASFSCATLDINNASKFINEGTITASVQISTKNNNSLLVNRATIIGGSFSTEGSSLFFNEDTGVVSIRGLSLVNSNSCTWDNSGSFTTETMTFNAASENWYNRCRLFVNGLLTIELSGGRLYVDGGGYVRCGSLYMNNSCVVLGSRAYFNVVGTATFGYQGYNPYWTQGHQGFFGVGEDTALLRIFSAQKANADTYPCINFFGKLEVTTEGFNFPQQLDEWHINYHLDDGAAAVSYDGGTTAIEGGSCGEAFTPEPVEEIPSTLQAYTYLFEDMTDVAGDYDFNDCVFSVTTPVDGQLTLTLWAAGCTKTLDLCLKTTSGNRDNVRVLISDVGRAFTTPAGKASDGYIVNTEMGYSAANEIYCQPVVITVSDLPSDFTLSGHGDFFIADAYGQVHIPAFTQNFLPGQVPYALRVPGEWNWPVEYMPVTSVYFGFEAWARDARSETDWYSRGYAEDYVFDKSLLPTP